MFEWFPGHMAKTLRLVEERSRLADLFVIVLDARAPLSTYNDALATIAPHKPRLFVVTKADLGDKAKLRKIMLSLKKNERDGAVLVNLQAPSARSVILKAVSTLLASRVERAASRNMLPPRHRLFVVGVPNAGKSTLINVLAKSHAVTTANRPGVTRGLQWVDAGPVQLLDTPGVLWPRFNDELTGVKLAIIGSIRYDIIPLPTLFYAGYKLLSTYYPHLLSALKLTPALDEQAMHANLVELCVARGFHSAGAQLDLTRGMNWFNTYLRDLKGVTYD